MKWNSLDWLFGLLAGVLFGLFIALSIVDGIIQPSSDDRGWIGFSGLIGYLIVCSVRGWLLWRKNPPASTRSSPTTGNWLSLYHRGRPRKGE
jgi:hypothetical protein